MRKMRDIVGEHLDMKGEIGIEVEMEGRDLPAMGSRKWKVEQDGSLRNGGLEYVLRRPVLASDVKSALKELWKLFEKGGATLDPTNRCSVHIHVNVQQMTELELFNFIVLYLVVEDALVRWCGDGRVGNLFCLRARDAETLLDMLEETSVDRFWHRLGTDKIRYAAMNCKALMTYGSLEFRSMRGTADPSDIETWVSILLKVKAAAYTFASPDEIINGFSQGGEEMFCRSIFGDDLFKELFNYKEWADDVYSGVRRCQCIAYGGNWRGMKESLYTNDLERGLELVNPKPHVDVNLNAINQRIMGLALDNGLLFRAEEGAREAAQKPDPFEL